MQSASLEIGAQTSVVHARAGPQRDRREERVVPRLPQSSAVLRRHRPLELLRAVLAGDLLHGARVLFDAFPARAVDLEEQRRLQRIAGLRIAVDGIELDLVERLDPGDRDAELNRGDDGLHGAGHAREGTHGGRDRLRKPVQAHAHFGDHAERALRPDEQPRQVVAGRRFARADRSAEPRPPCLERMVRTCSRRRDPSG
jgi:hypothetical protein